MKGTMLRKIVSFKLIIDWGHYNTYKNLNLGRYFNHYGFRHKTKECNNSEVCENCTNSYSRNNSSNKNLQKYKLYYSNEKFKNIYVHHKAPSKSITIKKRSENTHPVNN